MDFEISALDHLYLSVRDFAASERFYDGLMRLLGFKKGDMAIGGQPHAHYFNRHLQISIRPARVDRPHEPYAPGLHHLCLRMPSRAAIDAVYQALVELGVEVSSPALYPEYADDYYAIFFGDPDGIRFELVAERQLRRTIRERWDELDGFLNPVSRLEPER